MATINFMNFEYNFPDLDWEIVSTFSEREEKKFDTIKQKAIFVYKKLLSLPKYGRELKSFLDNLKYQLYKKDSRIGTYNYMLCTKQTSAFNQGFIYSNIDSLFNFIKQHGINCLENLLTFGFKNAHLIQYIYITSNVQITYINGKRETCDDEFFLSFK